MQLFKKMERSVCCEWWQWQGFGALRKIPVHGVRPSQEGMIQVTTRKLRWAIPLRFSAATSIIFVWCGELVNSTSVEILDYNSLLRIPALINSFAYSSSQITRHNFEKEQCCGIFMAQWKLETTFIHYWSIIRWCAALAFMWWRASGGPI